MYGKFFIISQAIDIEKLRIFIFGEKSANYKSVSKKTEKKSKV